MVDMYGNKINPNAVRKDGFFEFKKVNEYKSDLTIPISYKGETIEFLTTLYVDGDWLGIKFYQQKETTFYINKKNIENSYIDFRFLENPKIDYTPVHTADFYKDW
ncbi:hypothetical protein GCM10008083_26740 [Ulvibacter litoralis]|nr:hypothetical protein GCM10008083_26740 [Ulvibacter litoralis]